MKTIGIIGSRRRYSPNDLLKVQEAFCQIYEEGDKVCSGMCKKGADQFAVLFSDIWDADPIWHWPKSVPRNSPRWVYAKANFDRNTLIAENSDVLIACVANDRKGGTEDTIRKFKQFHPNGIVYLL